jgi:rhodanese-related sulfurtransferase
MKRFLFLQSKAIFILIFFLLPALSVQPSGAASQDKPDKHPETLSNNLSSREAWKLIRKNAGNPDFIILDVRTPLEFFNSRIPGAMNMDYYNPEFKKNLLQLDSGKTYLVYCKSGARSQSAVTLMKTMKFKSLFHLAGGINEWKNEGMPIQSGP